MLYRIVKMTFRPEAVDDFKKIFDEAQQYIISRDGCLSVQALQDRDKAHVFFTYSLWRDEAALDAYRSSERFSEIWKATKMLFAARAEAHSLSLIDERRK